VNSPQAHQPCMARDGFSEWKQWVLLRLAPYHWQRAGGLASANLSHYYYSSSRHSAAVAERSPVPPARRRLALRASRGSDVEVGPTINPKQNSKRPRVSTRSSPPWLRARRSPLLDSIGQMQMATRSRYTWPAAAISIVKICTQTRHSGLSVHPE
jgi:hypothetical protein